MISDGSIIMAKIGLGIIKAKILGGGEEKGIIRLNWWGIIQVKIRFCCPVLYRLKLKLLCFNGYLS